MKCIPICMMPNKNSRGLALVELMVSMTILIISFLGLLILGKEMMRWEHMVLARNELAMDSRFTRIMITNRIKRSPGRLFIGEHNNRIDSPYGDWKIALRDHSLSAILSNETKQNISQVEISPHLGFLFIEPPKGGIFQKEDNLIRMRWTGRVLLNEAKVHHMVAEGGHIHYEVDTAVCPDYLYFKYKEL